MGVLNCVFLERIVGDREKREKVFVMLLHFTVHLSLELPDRSDQHLHVVLRDMMDSEDGVSSRDQISRGSKL
jgi:hypothetical protein